MPGTRPLEHPGRQGLARRASLSVLAVVMLLVTAEVGGRGPMAEARAPSAASQRAFMWAMAGQESGWDYFARNRLSGAFGRYQIMPVNWPAWAATYLGHRTADQTPANQERVASRKLRALYVWLGSWRRVAYWWLTGDTERRERRWSPYARAYVRNVMSLRERAPRLRVAAALSPVRSHHLRSRGDWRRIGVDSRLRLDPAGRRWRRQGRLEDGAIVRIRRTDSTRGGGRWVRVVTWNGRLGWVNQSRTVPARAPARARQWSDVRTTGRR